MQQRVWELDVFRGVCIVGMVLLHLLYDLVELYRLIPMAYPAALRFLLDWGGTFFVALSGVCVTLGSRAPRRGLAVFAGGMLCTAVTWGMYRLGMADWGFVIRFGILHCLGLCMLLWPLLKKLPLWAMALLGIVLAAAGVYLAVQPAVSSCRWLFPLGIVYPGFQSGDYFPLLPFLGFFLLGAVIGRTVYRDRSTRFPGIDPNLLPFRALSACGRHSLVIYLLHQPLISGVLMLADALGLFQ